MGQHQFHLWNQARSEQGGPYFSWKTCTIGNIGSFGIFSNFHSLFEGDDVIFQLRNHMEKLSLFYEKTLEPRKKTAKDNFFMLTNFNFDPSF